MWNVNYGTLQAKLATSFLCENYSRIKHYLLPLPSKHGEKPITFTYTLVLGARERSE